MDRDELEQLLFDNAPEVLFERLLMAVFAAHHRAYEHCASEYERSEAVNLLPYERRARVEGFMRDAAEMTPGVKAKVCRSPKGPWNHTELRSGSAVLTASSVPTPCGMVDPAEFRVTLAKSGQGTLFPELDPPADDSTPLYVLLLHSRSQWLTEEDRQKNGHLPGSVYLTFPDPDLKTYVHDINLFDRYPHVVEANVPQEWNVEAKVSYIRQARKIIA